MPDYINTKLQPIDENDILKININKLPVRPLNVVTKKRPLEQHEIDHPPMKETTATMITEYVFIGDEETAYDPSFMRQNAVTHIVNTKSNYIAGLFDPVQQKEPMV